MKFKIHISYKTHKKNYFVLGHCVFTSNKVTNKRVKKLVDSSSEDDDEDQQWKMKKKIYIKQLEQDLKVQGTSYKATSKELKETWKKCKWEYRHSSLYAVNIKKTEESKMSRKISDMYSFVNFG